MKFLWKHLGTRVWLLVTSIVLVLAILIPVLATSIPLFNNSISLIFGGERANIVEDMRDELYDREFGSKAEALAAAEDFVVEAEKEGAVLLKNENGALPFKQEAPAVSVFGKNSVDLVYTGSGSASSSGSRPTLYDSLEAAGIGCNPDLKAFYEDDARSGGGRPANPAMTSGQRLAGFATGETPVSSYTSALESSYSAYDDAAIVVISRIGGEGFDLPRTMATDFTYASAISGAASPTDHYLELDANEKALLEYVKGKFDTVVVLLNVGTTMEVGALQADAGIDAILWMGFPGGTGVMAIGQLLTGKDESGAALSPSGHTTDTWAADFTKDPTWYNTGTYGSEFGNRYLYEGEETGYAFVNYEEGIYVGYRYYETRGYEEEQDGNAGWYAENVVYPFGYGLSYTTFEQAVTFGAADGSAIAADGKITAEITVTNTGSYAGKDVVQLYYTAPYTAGGIEKAHVVLAAFAKTDTLYPASEANGTDKPNSQTLTLEFDVRDMASYDYADANGNGFKGYELEAGDYTVSARTDAHTAVGSATYTLAEGAQLRTDTDARGNAVTVENRFDDVSAGIFGTNTYDSYVSRADFAGTLPTGYLPDAERTLTAELNTALDESSNRRQYTVSDEGKPWQVTGPAPSTTPVDSGLSLADMLYDEQGNYVGSVDYDDPRWETLLNEISLDEMKTLVGFAAFRTNAVAGINGVVNKPMATDADGPSGFTSFLSESVIYDTCSYQGECVMGATWNTALAYRMGELVGEEGLAGDETGDGMPYSGWYAPAVNIHRSPFGGRNWEYYSEDGLLSGKFAAEVIEGARTKGVYCYVKHFAVNDQETDREYNGILVWANEQCMRELYLKPFELAVKEGGAVGMMSSFNRLGMTWAGGSYALLTEVLRDEWGFRGAVITDYSMNRYTYVDLMIRAGGDLFLTQDTKVFYKDDDATQITLLRNATKNVLYVTANSNVMSVVVDGYKMPLWQEIMIWVDVAAVVAVAVWGVLIVWFTRKKEKQAPAAEGAEDRE